MTKTDKRRISLVMSHFDFKSVHKMMKAVKWEWASASPPHLMVPTVKQLKSVALQLLKDVCEEGSGYSSVGGLVVKREDDGNFWLSFVFEESGSEEYPPEKEIQMEQI